MSSVTAEALVSLTPILDREAPLPQPAAPRSGARVIAGICAALSIAILASSLRHQPSVETIRQWILMQSERLLPGPWDLGRIVLVGLSSILIGYSVTAIHELGHLIVGIGVGFRCSSIFVGPIQMSAPFRISLNPDPRSWWHGGVSLYPGKLDRLCTRGVPMVLAGPGANLLTGCAALLFSASGGFLVWLFIVASIGAGVVELLLPLRGPTFVFDGRRIWMLLRDRGRGERWLALMRLIADTRAGVPPESLSADLLARATAVTDGSADTVIAHAFAYSSAFHRHEDGDAGQMLETCLRYASDATPAMRAGLMSDAAVFQARRRKRADLAEQWLADLPAATPLPWFRSRAEAAILEAKDDLEGASRKLDEGERSILLLPDRTQRELLLCPLRRWRSELEGRSPVRPCDAL